MAATTTLTLDQICALLGIEAPESLSGFVAHGMAALESAESTDISFVTRSKFRNQIPASKAGLILVAKNLKHEDPRLLRVEHVVTAQLKLLEVLYKRQVKAAAIHPSAVISESAKIGNGVTIGPNTVIGDHVEIGDGCTIGGLVSIQEDCSIGEGTIINDRVTIKYESKIGSRVLIHSGVVIGADGFRYEQIDQQLHKVPQVGNVVIGNDVEIGANTTIDRASLDSTIIGDRVKIDNLVMIGHNCVIGSDTIIVAQTGLAGSVKVGRGVIIGGQCGISDSAVIGDGVRIGAGTGIHHNVPAGSTMQWLNMDADRFKRTYRILHKLPEIQEEFQQLKELAVDYIKTQSES